jgi:hypothetical protein
MGVGNSTDEPVDYDHDDPGEPPSQNSVLLPSMLMSFGGGMLVAGLVCHCPPFPLIGGAALVIGGIWTFLANRQPRPALELGTGGEKLSTGGIRVKKTLKPCQYHVDPTPFATGTTVTFYRQGTAEEIGRVEIGGPQAMVTMTAQNPVTQPLTTTVNSVILTKPGGSYQIDVLETS